ncbi:MAG: GAF domain-containing protein [Chloroflexi bacterium]|nr:GAF domain-containing protein [Chloroflexota bacterium]
MRSADAHPGPGAAPPEEQSRLLRSLHELSVTTSRSVDADELVKRVAHSACQLLAADAVSLYLWDDSSDCLVPVYSNDPRVDEQPLRPGEGAAGQALARLEPILVQDYATYEHAVPWASRRGLQSVEAVPLLVGDRPIGVLVASFYHRVPLGPNEERLLALLAAHLAPALEAARLYAASDLERQRERVLREITQALAANLTEREVLALAVRHSARLLRAPYARIWLLEPDGELSCAAAEGFVHSGTFSRRLERDSTSGRVARQQIVNLENAPAETSWRFNREFGERTGLSAYLGAGLWRAGQSLGVLEVMRQTQRRFDPSEEQLLVSVANAVAVAVSNARTHAAVERLAREAERRATALAESELLLRSVYDAIGSGVLVFDSQELVINANAAAEEILGRNVTSLVGMHSGDFKPAIGKDGSPMPPDQRPFAVAARTGVAVRKIVFQIERPDGQRRWVQVDAVPLFDGEGDLRRVISSFIDITDRKRSEAALHERDTILEAVAFAAEQLLTAPDWEQSIDAVLRELGAATGVSRVYIVPGAAEEPEGFGAHQWTAGGISPRQLDSQSGSYLQASGLHRWEAILREGSIVQGQSSQFPPDEQEVLASQGVCSLMVVPVFAGETWWGFVGFDDCREERTWAVGAVEVVRTAAGTIGAAILRRRAEAERLQLVREQSARAAAEAAQARFAFLAEASRLLAASLDYTTTLQSVAHLAVPTLADYCAVDMRQPDGSVWRVATAHVDPETEDWLRARGLGQVTDPNGPDRVARVIRTGEPLLFRSLPEEGTPAWVREARRVAPDRPIHFTSGLMVPLYTRAGLAGVITCLALRQRRPYDARDLSLAQDLARRCSMAIENADLYREAREAISIRDEFLSVAAHELKTPMTSLRGYAQLLEREFQRSESPNPVRAARAALTIQVQADKLARLVGQLLDVSRIQSGMLAIQREQTDVTELVRGAVDAARNQLREHTILFDAPGGLVLEIDPLRIEQVVTNLLDNAIKYSPEGGQIEVSVSADDGFVDLSVRDHGVGVPIEHRGHIFDRFYQAHAGGPLTSMAGMGLGLYISRQIVELHGGSITAEYPDDGGTRLNVKLPRLA